MHSRNLLVCLCPAVLHFQQLSGWLKPPRGPGPVKMRLLPVFWRRHHLLPDPAVCGRHTITSPMFICPLILTHMFSTGSTSIWGRAPCIPTALSYNRQHLLLPFQPVLPKKPTSTHCSTPAVLSQQVSNMPVSCSPATASRSVIPPAYFSCCMHWCTGTSERHPVMLIFQER